MEWKEIATPENIHRIRDKPNPYPWIFLGNNGGVMSGKTSFQGGRFSGKTRFQGVHCP